MRSSTPISPCTHRSSGVVTRIPPPATVSSAIAATMAAPPSQSSRMCPASSTVSSLAAWTSSLPSTVVWRRAACSARAWPVCSRSVPCTRTRSRPATRSAFVCERPASMRSDSPRRSASPPTSCSMVSDRSSRAKASSTGGKSRFDTGSAAAGATAWGSGSGDGGSASVLVTVATGCAGIGVAEGVASIMCAPRRSGPRMAGLPRVTVREAGHRACAPAPRLRASRRRPSPRRPRSPTGRWR